MKTFKLACIGSGYFAPFHIRAWKRIPEVELVTLCDLDIEKAHDLARAFDIPEVTNKPESIANNSEIDIVDIITPPSTHYELCDLMIRKEKHVICQKPLAPDLAEARRIVQLADQGVGRFMVHENFRFQPWYRKMKQLLSDGVIGSKLHTVTLKMRMGDGWGAEAYLDRQPYFREMDRLLIHETGIHYIDVFRFLFGEIVSVYARLRNLNPVIKGEDTALIIFDFAQGGVGLLDGNRYNEPNYDDPRYTFGETTVEGDQGTMRLYGDGSITLQALGGIEQEVTYQHEQLDFASDCVYQTQKHFIKSLVDHTPFETNGTDYLRNLLVQEAIYESNAKQLPIQL